VNAIGWAYGGYESDPPGVPLADCDDFLQGSYEKSTSVEKLAKMEVGSLPNSYHYRR
jgi:hypothetical protein